MGNYLKCIILDLNLHLMDDKKFTYLCSYVRDNSSNIISLEIHFHVEKYENI